MTYRDGANEQFGKNREINVLWVTAGLGCDGDTIAITAATQPSLEEVIQGAIPGIPTVNFINPFLAYENGEDFMEFFHRAAAGNLEPFILVIEGSIPDENNKAEGYWAGFGTDRETGQPITTCEWIDRLAPNAWAVVAAGTCATYGGIHAMEGNPTGCMGLADYLGWNWKSKSEIPIVCVPGCPVFQTSSCPSWMNRRAANYLRAWLAYMAMRCPPYDRSPTRHSTKNRNGVTDARN